MIYEIQIEPTYGHTSHLFALCARKTRRGRPGYSKMSDVCACHGELARVAEKEEAEIALSENYWDEQG